MSVQHGLHMFHVLARTSRQMGVTAWPGSQSVQYYPHIHECPSCILSSLVRHERWELRHGLALNLFNTILTFMSVHHVSCPRSYVTTYGSYSMVWLSICSLLSSHSWVSIMFHVLARTSRKMGATAWSGSVLVCLHRAKHAHKHTQSYTMIRLAFSKMRWGFGTLASHDCVSDPDGYCQLHYRHWVCDAQYNNCNLLALLIQVIGMYTTDSC